MICPLIAPGVTGIAGWYHKSLVVLGARHYIREHSRIYVRENRYLHLPEHPCLLRIGITYRYEFTFSYLAPGSFAA